MGIYDAGFTIEQILLNRHPSLLLFMLFHANVHLCTVCMYVCAHQYLNVGQAVCKRCRVHFHDLQNAVHLSQQSDTTSFSGRKQSIAPSVLGVSYCHERQSSSNSSSCSQVRVKWSVRLTGEVGGTLVGMQVSHQTVLVKRELSWKATFSIYRPIYVSTLTYAS